jgi:DNA-binding beta-propeller fold protein YncE
MPIFTFRRTIFIKSLLGTPVVFLFLSSSLFAQVDISNPQRLMFVADADDPIIDVIDLQENEVIFRIETKQKVDDLVATPFAPVLIYTNIDKQLVSMYNLETQELAKEVILPIVPRHMVLDTTGSKIGFTDSESGGFVLLSAYGGQVLFTLEDFPPTTDVLFDPNEVDIWYSNDLDGSIGLIDSNVKKTFEIEVTDKPEQMLSSPSRSLDGRYIYAANETTGEVYSVNAFSKIIYKTFNIGTRPARPYTTPEGVFLYMMDKDSGRFVSIEQHLFTEFDNTVIGEGIDLITVGRFDRLNLLASTENHNFYIYDNNRKAVIEQGKLNFIPLDAQGAADGRQAYLASSDSPEVAIINLEDQQVSYIKAANGRVGAFAIGLSNNVCH